MEARVQTYSFRTNLAGAKQLPVDAKIEGFGGLFGIDQRPGERRPDGLVTWKITYGTQTICDDVAVTGTETAHCRKRSAIDPKSGARVRVAQIAQSGVRDGLFAGILRPSLKWSEPSLLSRLAIPIAVLLIAAALFALSWLLRRRSPKAPHG